MVHKGGLMIDETVPSREKFERSQVCEAKIVFYIHEDYERQKKHHESVQSLTSELALLPFSQICTWVDICHNGKHNHFHPTKMSGNYRSASRCI